MRSVGLAGLVALTACTGTAQHNQTRQAADAAGFAACIGYAEYEIDQPLPPSAPGVIDGLPPNDLLLAETEDQFQALARTGSAADTSRWQAIRSDARAVGRPSLDAAADSALSQRCDDLDRKYRP